ncbi:MAG: hydrogenase 3 maturation endopeptidase HyCI [Candidatus Riflebacteria bacterium]|nr:hydrogenase 3 maturation endopeptidase HyCI [Candidatus Riflebacteria bacterium]
MFENKITHESRIAVIGVGSSLHSDDAVGLMVAETLKDFTLRERVENIKVFIGETAPENLTGEIKRFKPTHIILIDAADFKGKPGESRILNASETNGVSFSTHIMPLKIILDYLEKSTGATSRIIGIQPLAVNFGSELSLEVKSAIPKTVDIILSELNLFQRSTN